MRRRWCSSWRGSSLALAALLTLAGCGSGDDNTDTGTATDNSTATPTTAQGDGLQRPMHDIPDDAAGSPAASTSPSRSTPTARPRPLPTQAPEAVESVARQFIAERENAIAYTHDSPRSWLARVRPLMTSNGYDRLSTSTGQGSGGAAFVTAHRQRWSVRANSSCTNHPEAPRSADVATLLCRVVDVTLREDGFIVPRENLPPAWAYAGQKSAVLVLRRVGGRWLVEADLTGQAG